MSLTLEQVAQVAQLARLQLSPGRAERYARELGAILSMVDQLAQTPTAGVEPMAHPLGMHQRLREDAATDPVGVAGRAAFQSVAPAVADGLYLVPKVIE
ncbi:MAG: Asp-tRNA(Asn)/Glu-tRNA(Gln) amidotransferase subunit GatC [Gammaproteobacteria bacterium]|nr:Asp-tRNA(Asn)/Glu-tRNA(Gln) amidotransferase subunit GatC [Gammaproteobacteria bacterium]